MTGCGASGLRMTRRGTASAPGAADWPLKATNADDWVADVPPEGAADAPAARCGAGAAGAPPPPLARRELDAALGTLFHVDGDPSLAVRALRHVFLELDAALRARRRVLRDEGAALPALDHLAESEDFPIYGDADHHGHRGPEDHEEEPVRETEDRNRLGQERQGLLHRDRLGHRLDDARGRRDDQAVRSVCSVPRDGDRAAEGTLAFGRGGVRGDRHRSRTQLDRQIHG